MPNREENPYLPRPVTTEQEEVVESSEEEHIQVRDNNGVLHSIGTVREVVLYNPATGQRHFLKTTEYVRSSDDRLILEPGHDQLFQCSECKEENVSHYSIAYCALCSIPAHVSCLHPINETQRLCTKCSKALFWKRLKAWFFSLAR